MSDESRERRLTFVLGGVVLQALGDARATGIVLLAGDTPEARLAERLLRPALGSRLAVLAGDGTTPADVLRAAARAAETRSDALLAHPVNKTAALLGGAPPVPLLPLADLWGTQVQELADGCSLPERVQSIADAAGGLEPLDRALQLWVDRRHPVEQALAELPAPVRGTILALWEDTCFARRRIGLVPKLGARTLGVDLFD